MKKRIFFAFFVLGVTTVIVVITQVGFALRMDLMLFPNDDSVALAPKQQQIMINNPKNTSNVCKFDDYSLSTWTIIVTANYAYNGDFLNWWHYCHDVSELCRGKSINNNNNNNNNNSDNNNDLQVILYAEDEQMYQQYQNSTKIIVKKAWDVQSKYTNIELTGQGRFSYSDRTGFREMMSRRPSIVLQELNAIKQRQQHEAEKYNICRQPFVILMDLDIMLFQDPRPYIINKQKQLLTNNNTIIIDFWAADAQNEMTGPYNAGFLIMQPTTSMIQLIRKWKSYLEKQQQAKVNQKTFNNIVRRMDNLTKNNHNDNFHHVLLNSTEFPVGKIFLNAPLRPLDTNVVIAFHNNYCEKTCDKIKRANELQLWNPSKHQDVM